MQYLSRFACLSKPFVIQFENRNKIEVCMEDLLKLREEIDIIDNEIVSLYEKRMKIAEGVARFKIETGKKVFDREREVSKLNTLSAKATSDFTKVGIIELFEHIMAVSRKKQYQLLTESGLVEVPELESVNDFVLPNDSAKDRLIVSVHEYADAFDWQLESIMRQLSDFEERIGVPVMVNEWGYSDYATRYNYELQKAAYANYSYYSNKYGIKSYVWDNGGLNNFGIINRNNYNHSDGELLYAITHPKEHRAKEMVVIRDVNDPNMNLEHRLSKDPYISGIEYHPWWGFLSVGAKEHGYVIPKGTKQFQASILKHTTDLKAIRFETYSCRFYDENDNYVGGASWKNNGILVNVPSEAKYVRVLCYNQFEECKPEQIAKWFEDGELAFYMAFYDI